MEKCWTIYPPPPEITREDLPLKSSVRFTPPKSPGKMEDLLLKLSVQFTPLPPEIAFISNFLAPKIDIN